MMRRIRCLLLALALGVTLIGCAPVAEESQIFAMDTIMSLTVYGRGAKQALDHIEDEIYTLEQALSATREGSEIHTINAECGKPVTVSQQTAQLLRDTLALCRQTGGALDITAYSAVKAWGFTTQSYRVPTAEELEALAEQIDYSKVAVDETTVYLPEGMQLDLGAVAKGYTGDVLCDMLRQEGITSACLSLGGNVQTVGRKPDGSPWRVGIQDPDGDGCLAVVEVTDSAVVTSGSYQRYFEENGQTYWHIIDPNTAAPARSGLASVSVIGAEGLRCDALSTALFVMGLEEASDFWRSVRDFEAVFVTQDGGIFITGGLKDSFTLGQGYEQREVTVIE